MLGWCCHIAPSATSATSKHCPDIMSPCPLQGSTGPPGTQGPAGTKVWHQHWHQHGLCHVPPGRGKWCLVRFGGWWEGHIWGYFGMEGGRDVSSWMPCLIQLTLGNSPMAGVGMCP